MNELENALLNVTDEEIIDILVSKNRIKVRRLGRTKSNEVNESLTLGELLGEETTNYYQLIKKYSRQDILKGLLNLKKYSLLEQIVINKNEEDMFKGHEIEIINEIGYAPRFLYHRNDLFNYYISIKRYDIALSFYDSNSDELDEKIKKILLNEGLKLLDSILDNPELHKYNFQFSNIFLQLCIKEKKYDYLKYFNSSSYSYSPIVDDLDIKSLYEYYRKKEEKDIPSVVSFNKKICDYAIKQKDLSFLVKIYIYDLPIDVLNDNLDYFAKNLKQIPISLRENVALFTKILEYKRINLLSEFDNNLFTSEIVKQYPEIFADYIEEFYYIFSEQIYDNLFNSKEVLEIYLQKKYFHAIDKFSPTLFDESIINQYYNAILNLHYLPDNLKDNQFLLAKYLDNEKYLIHVFNQNAFTNEIINKYFDKILNLMWRGEFDFLKNNQYLFLKCFELNNLSRIFEFNDNLFTKEIVDKYAEKIFDYSNLNLFNVKLKNPLLLEKCIELEKFEYLKLFSDDLIDRDFIDKNFVNLLKFVRQNLSQTYIVNSFILKDNIYFLEKCLENNLFEMLEYFNEDLFNENLLNKYGKKIIDNIAIIPNNLINNNKFKEICIRENRIDLILQIPLNKEIIGNQEQLNFYSNLLQIPVDELNSKLMFLYNNNDEIFSTLQPPLLQKKLSCFSIRHIERLSIYKDIQIMLCNQNEKFILLLSKLIEKIDMENYDISPIIYKILSNADIYSTIIENINIDRLNDDIINTLIIILQDKNNYYDVKNLEDLNNINVLIEKKELEIQSKINNNTINVNELKEAVIHKKIGMSMEQAEFIFRRYCEHDDSLNNDLLSLEIRKILKTIRKIYLCNSIDELKVYYLTSNLFYETIYNATILEEKIRSEYAKIYSDSLYKVKPEHQMRLNYNIDSNGFDVLSNVAYNGVNPQFYILDGDFNMQIHVLGAYRHWERPENFRDDWTRPKIAYHGICTSYIGNNQIANARNNHPTLGFDHYENSALLLCGNYDLVSDSSISQYATSINKPYNFYDPKTLIDKTRHTHNEMVLERRNNLHDGNFKRMPDYIIYFTNDINNISSEIESDVFKETIQAAVDMNVPIVIVDRLKYAKSEYKKIEEKITEFKQKLNIHDLEYIIRSYCNNMIGCKYFYTQQLCEYHKIFNFKGFLTLVFDLYKFLLKYNDERIINDFNQILEKEKFSSSYIFRSIYQLYVNGDETIKKQIETEINNVTIPNMDKELNTILDKFSSELNKSTIK